MVILVMPLLAWRLRWAAQTYLVPPSSGAQPVAGSSARRRKRRWAEVGLCSPRCPVHPGVHPLTRAGFPGRSGRVSGLRPPRAAQRQGWGPGCLSPLPASWGQWRPLDTGAGGSEPSTLPLRLFQSPGWRPDPWAVGADDRHSRVAPPAGAARAGHHAAGPKAHLQRVQDHVVLHVEEESAGRHPLSPLHGPGRRGRRRRGGGRSRGRRRLRHGHPCQHFGRPSAEQRGRGR